MTRRRPGPPDLPTEDRIPPKGYSGSRQSSPLSSAPPDNTTPPAPPTKFTDTLNEAASRPIYKREWTPSQHTSPSSRSLSRPAALKTESIIESDDNIKTEAAADDVAESMDQESDTGVEFAGTYNSALKISTGMDRYKSLQHQSLTGIAAKTTCVVCGGIGHYYKTCTNNCRLCGKTHPRIMCDSEDERNVRKQVRMQGLDRIGKTDERAQALAASEQSRLRWRVRISSKHSKNGRRVQRRADEATLLARRLPDQQYQQSIEHTAPAHTPQLPLPEFSYGQQALQLQNQLATPGPTVQAQLAPLVAPQTFCPPLAQYQNPTLCPPAEYPTPFPPPPAQYQNSFSPPLAQYQNLFLPAPNYAQYYPGQRGVRQPQTYNALPPWINNGPIYQRLGNVPWPLQQYVYLQQQPGIPPLGHLWWPEHQYMFH